jgi:hypothetical protein
LWSLAVAGILLSRSRVITGIFFHEYHYDWLWTPVRLVLVLIAVVGISSARYQWLPAGKRMVWTALALYFAGGVYLSAICVTRTWSGIELLQNYQRFKAQRSTVSAKPLVAGSTVAGADDFCELAAVAENQWVLSGDAVPRSLSVDNEQWEVRSALNAYLVGMDRAEFDKNAQYDAQVWFWVNPEMRMRVYADFMRKFDDVVHDPARYIAASGVRYVALPSGQARMDYLRVGWRMLQSGPYWQIWERGDSSPQ